VIFVAGVCVVAQPTMAPAMGQLVVFVLLFARAVVAVGFEVMPRRGGARLGHIGGITKDRVIIFPKL
jgi:hypothetical protein